MPPLAEVAWVQFQQLLSKALGSFGHLGRGESVVTSTSTWEREYHDALKVFSDLWSYQQEHRETLVERGLTRADIGDIASKIGQLYYSLYLRTSKPGAILEAYVFYEAIHARAYFDEQSPRGMAEAVKALKFYARFIIVCLLLNKKEEAWNLVQEFQALVSAFELKFGAGAAGEWQVVVRDAAAFLNADFAMPTPRSPGAYIQYRPNLRCSASSAEASAGPHVPRLREVVLAAYQPRQVKIAELPIDSFRMALALEWHDARLAGPSGNSSGVSGSGDVDADGDGDGSAAAAARAAAAATDAAPRVNGAGAALASGAATTAAAAAAVAAAGDSPYRQITFRPSAPALLHLLASTLMRLRAKDVLLVHLAGLGHWSSGGLPKAGSSGDDASATRPSGAADDADAAAAAVSTLSLLPSEPEGGGPPPAAPESLGVFLSSPSGAAAGVPLADLFISPGDLAPFTRRQMVLVVDSDASRAFASLSLSESGCTVPPLCLLSPPHRPSALREAAATGCFFTMALTCPVMAMCVMAGEVAPTPGQLAALEQVLDDGCAEIARTLLAALHPAAATSSPGAGVPGGGWAVAVEDALLRQLVARFVFVRAALSMHVAARGRDDCQPSAVPELPLAVGPGSAVARDAVLAAARVFKREGLFTPPS